MQLGLREMLQIGGLLRADGLDRLRAQTREKSAEMKEKNSRWRTLFYEDGNILLHLGRGSDVAFNLAYSALVVSIEAQGGLDANQPKIDN